MQTLYNFSEIMKQKYSLDSLTNKDINIYIDQLIEIYSEQQESQRQNYLYLFLKYMKDVGDALKNHLMGLESNQKFKQEFESDFDYRISCFLDSKDIQSYLVHQLNNYSNSFSLKKYFNINLMEIFYLNEPQKNINQQLQKLVQKNFNLKSSKQKTQIIDIFKYLLMILEDDFSQNRQKQFLKYFTVLIFVIEKIKNVGANLEQIDQIYQLLENHEGDDTTLTRLFKLWKKKIYKKKQEKKVDPKYQYQ